MNPQDIYEKVQALVQKEIQVAMDKNEQDQRFKVADIPVHEHTGTDSSQINFTNLEDRKLYIQAILPNTEPQTAANYGVQFIAPFGGLVTKIMASYEVASTSGTLQVEKLTGTTAPHSGISLLASPISLSATANTVYTGTLTTTFTATQIAAGDRIGIVSAGTLTNLIGLCVIIELIY